MTEPKTGWAEVTQETACRNTVYTSIFYVDGRPHRSCSATVETAGDFHEEGLRLLAEYQREHPNGGPPR